MKSIFRSRTFWFNLLGAVALIVSMPEVTGLLSPDAMKYAVGVGAVVNILLRFVTTQSVSVKGTGDGK